MLFNYVDPMHGISHTNYPMTKSLYQNAAGRVAGALPATTALRIAHIDRDSMNVRQTANHPMDCPFSSTDYLSGLSNIGNVDQHPEWPLAVLRRGIPCTDHVDGVGPWPYRWITDDHDIDMLLEGFRHLVTLSVVTHPGWMPSQAITAKTEIRLLKQHYMFDPAKPTPALSRRAHRRVMDADKRGRFEVVASDPERLQIIHLYQQLKLRRGFTGGLFDMPPRHFEAISRLPNAVFFQVRDNDSIGAMACGLIINDFLQVLHLVTTEHGLTWNASYLMMHGLQDYVRRHGLRLLTGGMPMSGTKGLATFKSRWANAFLPVHLLCIVNDAATANQLAAGRASSSDYFPRYRHFD